LAISDKYKYYRFARKSHKLHNITLIEKTKQQYLLQRKKVYSRIGFAGLDILSIMLIN